MKDAGATMTLFDAVDRCTAAWSFRRDPVPDDLIEQVLAAATKGPSGGNLQPWRFVVVRDPVRRQAIAALYGQAWEEYAMATARTAGAVVGRRGASALEAGAHLARTLVDVPVLVVVCMTVLPPQLRLRDAAGGLLDVGPAYASIYPAVQNLMLAATALGLATRLTTLHRIRECALKTCLKIPDDIETVALLPIGYPARSHKRRKRRPLSQLVFWERWGARARPGPGSVRSTTS